MDGLERFWQNIAAGPSILWVLWLGLAAVTTALLVLMRTRFGRNRPMRKCVVLSLAVHALIGGYFWHVKIVGEGGVGDGERIFHITSVHIGDEEAAPARGGAPRALQPWEKFAPQKDTPDAAMLQRQAESAAITLPERPVPEADQLPPPIAPERMTHQPLVADRVDAFPAPAISPGEASAVDPAAAADVPRPQPQTDPPAESPGAAQPPRREVEAPSLETDRPPSPPSETFVPDVPSVSRKEPSKESTLADDSPLDVPAVSVSDEADAVGPEAIEKPSAPLAAVGAVPGQDPSRLQGPSSMQKQGPEPDAELTSPQREIPIAAGNPSQRGHEVPELYQLRVKEGRLTEVRRRGGSNDTEQAVKAALVWLAENQESDGRWDAGRHGAGQEQQTQGHNRLGAGARAHTGVTGLALMTFLGAGHTHEQGEYRETVRAALDYLIRSQSRSGDLGGDAEMYAAMYCHGMATLALAEAYGMTGDPALRQPLESAIDFTLKAQLADGGWRYRPGDPRGDTSQLGWQLMALRSAEVSGLDVPAKARTGMVRFLRGVASGNKGGLSSYRAGEKPSRTMTAEGLFCRQLLGAPRDNPASNEAGDYVLRELPGQGEPNLYYWYYATLATYQLQGEHWEEWNAALQTELLRQQRQDGDLTGSYDPDAVWGPYGGRVYSTALATLCLEVYYRYVPVYSAMERKLSR